MALLFSHEILESIKSELSHAKESVRIITAYCKLSSFLNLSQCVNQTVTDKKLLIRFRKDDIVKGSTDFNILEEAISNGWKVYVRFDLHAKTYIVDNKRGFVGSANVTNSGLSIGKSGNMEVAALVDVEPNDIEKINNLFGDAIFVDDNILNEFKRQMESVDLIKEHGSCKWDSSITKLFNPHINTLFSYELPDAPSINADSFVPFLDMDGGDVEMIRDAFRWSNSYLWLLNVLGENEGCLYFGALSERLHNSIVSDPKPYRKDVKTLLANLLSLIEELHMDEVIIDRPNYSQRVRLKSIV